LGWMPQRSQFARRGAGLVVQHGGELSGTWRRFAATGKLLDFTKPVDLLFVACLHNIPDHDDPAGIVARYLTALAPGSYLVISHVTDELDPDRMHAITAEYAKRGTVFVGRSKEAIQRIFDRELADPGVVPISYWRPDSGQPDYNADQVWGYCGVARV